MSLTKIWLVRHGETERSVAQRFNGREDVALTDRGRQQCRELAQRLAKERIDAVYASPLRRCLETARLLIGERALPIQLDLGLIEMDYGVWEGKTYQEARELDPHVYAAWEQTPDRFPPPNGETGEAVAQRAIAAVRAIVMRSSGQTILIVAHKTVNRLLLASLRGEPLRGYRSIPQELGALSQVEWHADGHVTVQILRATDRGCIESDRVHLS